MFGLPAGQLSFLARLSINCLPPLITAEFIKHHRADASVYCDLQGFRATGNPPSTIPPEILPTSARPDIVIVSAGCISMVELAVPWSTEDSLASAKRHKTTKDNYRLVLSDVASQNIRATLITVEIGCPGHHMNDLFCALKHLPLPPSHCSKTVRYELQDRLSRSVIASSYTIFRAYRPLTWQL